MTASGWGYASSFPYMVKWMGGFGSAGEGQGLGQREAVGSDNCWYCAYVCL